MGNGSQISNRNAGRHDATNLAVPFVVIALGRIKETFCHKSIAQDVDFLDVYLVAAAAP